MNRIYPYPKMLSEIALSLIREFLRDQSFPRAFAHARRQTPVGSGHGVAGIQQFDRHISLIGGLDAQ
jgi:hypothetical protein